MENFRPSVDIILYLIRVKSVHIKCSDIKKVVFANNYQGVLQFFRVKGLMMIKFRCVWTPRFVYVIVIIHDFA